MKASQQIYLLLDPNTRLIKIGCSRVPRERRRALSKAIGRELILIYRRKIERDAFRFESGLHRAFAAARVHREWFAVAPEDIIAEIRRRQRQAA